MTVRFFILQAHYRGTLDFSNEALIAAAKAYKKIINGLNAVKGFNYNAGAAPADNVLNEEVAKLTEECFTGLNDDFNTAATIASLFNLLKKINQFHTRALDINSLKEEIFEQLKATYIGIVEQVLGLVEEKVTDATGFMKGLLEIYRDAKETKQYDKVDKIRTFFKAEGVVIKDTKTSIEWAYEE
jgi:cysteinyl-tRNA synthetase